MDNSTFLLQGVLFSTIFGILGAYIATKLKPNSQGLITNLVIGGLGVHLFRFIIAMFGINPVNIGGLILAAIFDIAGGFILVMIVSNFKKTKIILIRKF